MKLTKLKGHTDMVTCASFCEVDSNICATGSEDTSVRLWDIRTCKSIKRLSCNAPVASVANVRSPDKWIVGAGNSILLFDMRGSDNVLVSTPNKLLETSDDVSDLVVNIKSVKQLKTSIDSKDVVDEAQESLEKLSMDGENYDVISVDDEGNLSIVSGKTPMMPTSWVCHPKSVACAVRKVSNDLMVSGGFDNTLVFSSLSAKSIVHRISLVGNSGFNPPHIHSIDAIYATESASMASMAVAIGDGSVGFVDLSVGIRPKSFNWHKVFESFIRIPEVHRQATGCVRFLSPEMIASVGNDKVMALLRKTRGGSFNIHNRFVLPASPNMVTSTWDRPGQVLICDTDSEAKLGTFE